MRLGHDEYDSITCGKMQDLIFHDGLGQPEVVVLSQQQVEQPSFNEQLTVGSWSAIRELTWRLP
jgi:hypothetical protein